jgi:tetratricopeptide (TPR) repeat protein
MSGKEKRGQRPGRAAARALPAPPAPATRRANENGLRRFYGAVGLAVLAAGGWLVRRESAAAGGGLPLAADVRGAVAPELQALIQHHVAALARAPSARNHAALGLVYEANELWERAAECFARAAALDPADSTWPLHQGIVASELGDLQSARAHYERAVALRSDLAAARFRLADALQRSGRLAEALEHYRAAAELAPLSSEAHTGLGAALSEQGGLAEARVHLERACTLDPDYKSAHYQLGRVLRELGEKDAAARELALGVDAHERYVPDPLAAELGALRVSYSSRLDGAAALIRKGRLQEGIAILEAMLAQRPDDLNVLNNLAVACMEGGSPERARHLLERARALSETEFPVWISLSSLASRTGAPEEALRHADRAVALAADVGAAHFARGRALLTLGRFEEAAAALRRATELDARDPQAQLMLGVVCAELARTEEAETHFMNALRLRPDWLDAHVALARMYFGLARFDEALELLAETHRFAPEHPAVAELERKLHAAVRR